MRDTVTTPTRATRRKTAAVDTRELLLESAEQLLREEGYAAVTSRRLGEKAGVHGQLVHYYFKSMDSMFIEMWRRTAERSLAEQMVALASPRPLSAFWKIQSDPRNAAMLAELMAAGRHRPALRAEISASVGRIRKVQAGALDRIMRDYGMDSLFDTPQAFAVILAGIGRILTIEKEFGIPGSSKVGDVVRKLIEKYEETAIRK